MRLSRPYGYGHGALPVAQVGLARGGHSLGVATSRREWKLPPRRGSRPPCWVMGNLKRTPRTVELPALAAECPSIRQKRQACLCRALASWQWPPHGPASQLDTGIEPVWALTGQTGPSCCGAHAVDAVQVGRV